MTTDTVKFLNECILGYQKQVDILQMKINSLKAYIKDICEHEYELTFVRKIPADYLESAQFEYNYECKHCSHKLQNYFYR